MHALIVLAAVGEAACSACPRPMRVPEDFPTIQAAVDAAANGDEVRVAAGTYIESIHWSEKSVVLIGAGQDATIVDPSLGLGGRCLTLIDVSPGSVVRGLTCRMGRADERGAPNGGGMLVQGGSVAVGEVTFSRNAAREGGGGLWIDGADVTLEDTSFTDNEAGTGRGGNGAGLCAVSGSRITVLRSTFSRNETNPHGGGMLIRDGSVATVIDSRFVGNSGEKGGGGIWADDSDLRVSGCLFVHDETGIIGAAIAAYGCTVMVTDSTFDRNAAVGRVFPPIDVTGKLTIARSSITRSTGGGIRAQGDLTVLDCAFEENTGPDGGAINVWGTASVTGSIFIDNVADGANGHSDVDAHGGAILASGDLRVSRCVFQHNVATGKHPAGGALYMEKGHATLEDSLLMADAPEEIAGPGEVTLVRTDVVHVPAEAARP